MWQTAWDDPVHNALRSQSSLFSQTLVLTTEISWKSNKAQIRRTGWSASTLASTGHPWGAVLRIGHQRSLHTAGSPSLQQALEEWKHLIQDTQHLPHPPSEYQIDYDCPERLLASYAQWLKAWRVLLPPDRTLTITGLPSWLDQPDLPTLLQQCDGFVLQVHTLSPPAFSNPQPTLCDPSQALRWVEKADAFRKPFRVALPTYSYLAAYQPNGTFLGLSAEAPTASWPAETILRRIDSSPEAMSRLVSTLNTIRPPHLQSILWFRLPVPSDQWNWSAATLRSVIQGTPPQPRIETWVAPDESGLSLIHITNSGSCAARFPTRIRVRGPLARSLIASDATPPYEIQQITADDLQLIARPSLHQLQPGQSQIIGWIRLAQPSPLQAEISPLTRNHLP